MIGRRSKKQPRRSFQPSRKSVLRGLATLTLAAACGAAVIGIPKALARMPVFTVTDVVVKNATYLDEEQVARAAGLDSTSNLWEDRKPLLERLVAHPLVESAKISRRPPGTLVVTVEEARPVGLVAAPVLTAVDEVGVPLPIDPGKPVLNLPILTTTGDSLSNRRTRILAEELTRISTSNPEVFAVVSEASHEGKHVALSLGETGIRVLFAPPLGERRLLEAVTVMNDALGRFPSKEPREIDLRYDDQVVVRYASQP